MPSTSKRNGLAAVFSASCTATAWPSRDGDEPAALVRGVAPRVRDDLLEQRPAR